MGIVEEVNSKLRKKFELKYWVAYVYSIDLGGVSKSLPTVHAESVQITVSELELTFPIIKSKIESKLKEMYPERFIECILSFMQVEYGYGISMDR